MTLETGIRGEQSVLVTAANTAKTMGSGTLEVFATPALVALAEKTCWMSVADALGEGNGSVGTKLELEHTAPTPVGMTVTCESELVAVEGRKLTFKVALHDEKGPVGGGTHERFVINNAKFAAKAEAKKGKTPSVIAARCHRSPFCRLHDIFPRPGEVFLNEGGFGSTVKFPFLPKALPLGELAPKVTERARTHDRRKLFFIHLLCLLQSDRRRVSFQQVLLSTLLRVLQKLCGLHAGPEQLKYIAL